MIRKDYTREMMGVFAAKSYFVLGDTIVCLGAGITDKNPEYGHEIITTINNTLCEGTPVNLEREDRPDMDYVVQGGILYGVRRFGDNRLIMQAEERKTHWFDLNLANTDVEDENVPVFELGISHGTAPVDAEYEYYMYCGKEEPESYLAEKEAIVLSNSTQIQAVINRDKTCIQAICYESGAAVDTEGIYLSMDYPGAVMLEKTDGGLYVTVCDGIQLEERREIMVSWRLPGEKEIRRVNIALPEKELTGKPVCRKI